jgi:RNA polymerase sigma factor (sigma-70 family)
VEAASAPRPHGIRIRKPRRLLAALSDERLVEHVRAGDAAAFELLYDRHSSGIVGFCRHMLGSLADAEDAAQQTFIAAHADILRHGKRDLHVKAWLYTIARNRCVSMLRARRERPADEELEVASERFSDEVEHREELRFLLTDVARLPDDQREALVLAEVGDLSHGDISQVLGCEVSKVKSLVFQARTALIDRRTARETPCEEIREQLATLRGGALRRSHLRHHLEACPGCTQYREDVRRQRAMLAVALPVIPTAALRGKVLGGLGLGGGGTAAGVAAGSGVASSSGFGIAAQSGLAKLGIAAALAAGGGGVAVATHNGVPVLGHGTKSAHTRSSVGAAAATSSTSVAGAHTAQNATVAGGTTAAQRHAVTHTTHRSASGAAHGFTPVQGQSNGARARQFAATRGQGKHTGLAKTHHSALPHRHSHPAHPKHVAKLRVTPPPKATPRTHTSPQPSKSPTTTTQTTTTPTQTSTTQAPTTTTPVPPVPSGGHGGAMGKGRGAADGTLATG